MRAALKATLAASERGRTSPLRMKSAMVGRWGGLGRSRALLSRLVRRHMAAGSMGSAGALLREPMLELRKYQHID